MQKDFDSWNEKKKDINTKENLYYFHAREVWWCSLGINIGYEQDGKNEQFERPVLIIKKYSKDTALAVPITSRIKENIYYFPFMKDNEIYSVVISQIRLISTKRLSRYMYRMSEETFNQIIKKLKEMF